MTSCPRPLQELSLRQSRRLRDPEFCSRFLIGAEFELYALAPEGFVPDPFDDEGSEGLFPWAQARAAVLAALAADHPRVAWRRKLLFHRDYSLRRCSAKRAGIEVVLRHCEGGQALALIGMMLRTFAQTSKFAALSDCGFHLNASFSDSSSNTPRILASVAEALPVSEMAARFGRERSAYCRDNRGDGVDARDALALAAADFAAQLAKTSGRGRAPRSSIAALSARLEAMKSPAALEEFRRLALAHAQRMLLARWEWDRPACAPRIANIPKASGISKSSRGSYCEFRMMGGKDYLLRPVDLAATIQQCLVGLCEAKRRAGAAPRGRPRKPASA